MSTTYLVDIDMKLASGVSSAVSSLSGAFTGLVEKAATVAKTIAGIGIATGIGAVTTGVFHLNKELENTKIGLGAIYNAKGFADGIGQGVEMAGKSVDRMRKDAAQLPGEFEDLKTILMGIATPALNAGMSIEGLHEMSSNTMAVAAVMGLQMDMASREASQLLEGRAGAHNVLGTRLGFTGEKAQEFNKKSAPERVTALQAEFAKYAPAIQQFGHSFEGISSSTTSNLKGLLQSATSPLFESIKTRLEDFNNWYAENESKINEWAQRIGKGLNDAFQWGETKIREWWPLLQTFATNAYNRIASIWEKVEPIVERIMNMLGDKSKGFLADPASIDKVVYALELYAGVKGVGAVMGVAGAFGGGGGGGEGGGGMAMFWKVASAATQGVGDLGGSAVQTGRYLTFLAAAALPAVALAAAAAAAAGSLYLVYDQSSKLSDEWETFSYKTARFSAGGLSDVDAKAREAAGERRLDEMYADPKSQYDVAAGMNYDDAEYQTQMQKLIVAGDGAGGALARLEASVLLAHGAMLEFNRMEDAKHEKDRVSDDDMYSMRLAQGMAGMVERNLPKPEKKKEHPGGAGVSIGVVEIQVTSNNEPGRVAQLVFDKIANLRRNRRSSYSASNFSR